MGLKLSLLARGPKQNVKSIITYKAYKKKNKETNKKTKTKIRIIAYLRRPKKESSDKYSPNLQKNKTKQNQKTLEILREPSIPYGSPESLILGFRVSLLVLGLGFFNFILHFANYPRCTFQTFPSPVLSLRNLVWNDCFYQGLISWKPKERISNEEAGIVCFFFSRARYCQASDDIRFVRV